MTFDITIQDGGKTPILKKRLVQNFSVSDVTIQDGGETPILEKDLVRIFVVRLRQIGCHGNRFVVPPISAWEFDQNQEKTCSEFFGV